MLKILYHYLTGQAFLCCLSGGGANGNSVTGAKSNQSDQRTYTTNNETLDTTNYEYTLDADVANTAIGMAQKVSSGITSAADDIASKAFDASAASTAHAYDYADNIFSSAIDFANSNDTRALGAYDRAAQLVSNSDALVQQAYADAKGTTDSQKQIILGVLAVAGIAMLAALKGRG